MMVSMRVCGRAGRRGCEPGAPRGRCRGAAQARRVARRRATSCGAWSAASSRRCSLDPDDADGQRRDLGVAHAAPAGDRIAVLWRAGLRIHEALALNEPDLDRRRGALLVRRGKGGRRREVGMDEWAWEHLQPWLDVRLGLPGRPAVLRHQRAHPRAHVVTRRRARRAAPHRHHRWCSPALRAPPAPATRTPSRWPTRESHSSASSASSATATSASPRSTSKASTTQRSSKPSTVAAHRWSRSARRFGSDAPGEALIAEAVAERRRAGGAAALALDLVRDRRDRQPRPSDCTDVRCGDRPPRADTGGMKGTAGTAVPGETGESVSGPGLDCLGGRVRTGASASSGPQ